MERVLRAAAQAPSSKNSQPWGVVAASGVTRTELSRRMCEKFDRGEFETPDYSYSPSPSPEWYDRHAKALGYALFDLKGIDWRDAVARRAHDRQNYLFFGAPLVLFFHLPQNAERGNFLDMGMFLQNVMVGLVSLGLGSCPQASVTRYSDTIRSVLGIGGDRWIVCGLAVGWPDPEAKVNTFVPPRVDLETFLTWRE